MIEEKIVKVFISCPMDVNDEAEIVYNKCLEYSQLLMSSENKIQIIPFYWKKDIVSEINISRDTLDVIIEQKKRKFKGKDEDIYIGIMWKKYGDKLSNTDFSPTEQEYQWALNRKKTFIQFYFKKSDIEYPNNEQLKEIFKVNDFQKKIQNSNSGMYKPFNVKDKFKKEIQKSLCYYIKNQTQLTYKKKQKKKYSFGELKSYISRRVYDVKSENQFYLFDQEKYSEDLINLVQKEKKIVLLGDAGTGKTFEFRRVAQYFSDDDKPLHPIYTSLNLYVDQNLEDYLPSEWIKYLNDKEIDENHLLIILDGFDEIEAKYKHTAQKKILNFCEKHPQIHFLVSCRSNFYKTETKEESGTLYNFQSFALLRLTDKQVNEYLKKKVSHKKSDKFIADILSKKIYHLLEIPFYLINLVSYYIEEEKLPSSKAEIFYFLINKRLKLDEQKYNTTFELDSEKVRIYNTLERLALGMELLCKNQITMDEYHKIVPNKELRDLIKYSTCWKDLKFEHNNFQEYLAAKVLSGLEFNKIKEIITFAPEYKRIIPSWTNTISFLFSILDVNNQSLIELKNWIVKTQPNILLCAEPDKIENKIRFEVFRSIFNSYKKKGLWINIQKFSFWDFVRFGESSETLNFLMNEMSKGNPFVSRKEAIQLSGLFSNLYGRDIEIKEYLKSIIYSETKLVYDSIYTLSNQNILNASEIDNIIQNYKDSDDDNIRFAIYKIINRNNLQDKYIDILLNGINLLHNGYNTEDKPINVSETYQIEKGLANAKKFQSLKKIISYVKNKPDSIRSSLIEKILEKITNNSVNIYKEENTPIFDIWFDLTIFLVKGHFIYNSYEKIVNFFEKTKTLNKAFLKVYEMELDLHDKMTLLSLFAENKAINFIIEEYEKKNISNGFVLSFQSHLRSFNDIIYQSFNKLLVSKFGDKFTLKPRSDYEKQRKKRLEKDMKLLFDKKSFIDEVKLIFQKIGKTNLKKDDLNKFDAENWDDRYYSELAYNIINDLIDKKEINLELTLREIDKIDWEWFIVSNIHKEMINEKYIPTNEQKEWIENWCKSNVRKVNFKTANIKKNNSYSRSWLSVYLVYFMKEFDFSYNENVMLDILSFVTSLVSIEFVEKYINSRKVIQRILSNLKEGIEIEEVLVNHINYCINNELDEVLNYVYSYLLLHEKDSYRIKELRNVSLDAIFKLANDYQYLKETLLKIQDDYKWFIVDRLIKENKEIKFVENYLLKLLIKDNEEDAFEASEYLILLENKTGLEYYVGYVKNNNRFRYRYWKDSPFNKLTKIELIPSLIKLLKIDYEKNIIQDKYESLYKHVTNALKSIALFSEENFLTVKDSILLFIKNSKNLKNVNQLHYFIEDLEAQFYVNKSDSIDIDEVVSKLNELNL